MSAAGSAPTRTERQEPPSGERRVTPLELFFDLVFVFALTQVTGLLAADPTWSGLLRAMALLAALWWAWVCYSWLTNAVPAEEAIPARLVILSAMAAMLVASLAVPGAFGEDGVIFGVAYLVVRLLHAALYALATGDEPEQQRAILGLAPWLLAGPVLLVAAGLLDGAAQAALWQRRWSWTSAGRSSVASWACASTPPTDRALAGRRRLPAGQPIGKGSNRGACARAGRRSLQGHQPALYGRRCRRGAVQAGSPWGGGDCLARPTALVHPLAHPPWLLSEKYQHSAAWHPTPGERVGSIRRRRRRNPAPARKTSRTALGRALSPAWRSSTG